MPAISSSPARPGSTAISSPKRSAKALRISSTFDMAAPPLRSADYAVKAANVPALRLVGRQGHRSVAGIALPAARVGIRRLPVAVGRVRARVGIGGRLLII